MPSAVTKEIKKIALNYAKDYVNTLLNTDITNGGQIKRNPKRAKAILKAYDCNSSTAAPMTTSLRDIESNLSYSFQYTETSI